MQCSSLLYRLECRRLLRIAFTLNNRHLLGLKVPRLRHPIGCFRGYPHPKQKQLSDPLQGRYGFGSMYSDEANTKFQLEVRPTLRPCKRGVMSQLAAQ